MTLKDIGVIRTACRDSLTMMYVLILIFMATAHQVNGATVKRTAPDTNKIWDSQKQTNTEVKIKRLLSPKFKEENSIYVRAIPKLTSPEAATAAPKNKEGGNKHPDKEYKDNDEVIRPPASLSKKLQKKATSVLLSKRPKQRHEFLDIPGLLPKSTVRRRSRSRLYMTRADPGRGSAKRKQVESLKASDAEDVSNTEAEKLRVMDSRELNETAATSNFTLMHSTPPRLRRKVPTQAGGHQTESRLASASASTQENQPKRTQSQPQDIFKYDENHKEDEEDEDAEIKDDVILGMDLRKGRSDTGKNSEVSRNLNSEVIPDSPAESRNAREVDIDIYEDDYDEDDDYDYGLNRRSPLKRKSETSKTSNKKEAEKFTDTKNILVEEADNGGDEDRKDGHNDGGGSGYDDDDDTISGTERTTLTYSRQPQTGELYSPGRRKMRQTTAKLSVSNSEESVATIEDEVGEDDDEEDDDDDYEDDDDDDNDYEEDENDIEEDDDAIFETLDDALADVLDDMVNNGDDMSYLNPLRRKRGTGATDESVRRRKRKYDLRNIIREMDVEDEEDTEYSDEIADLMRDRRQATLKTAAEGERALLKRGVEDLLAMTKDDVVKEEMNEREISDIALDYEEKTMPILEDYDRDMVWIRRKRKSDDSQDSQKAKDPPFESSAVRVHPPTTRLIRNAPSTRHPSDITRYRSKRNARRKNGEEPHGWVGNTLPADSNDTEALKAHVRHTLSRSTVQQHDTEADKPSHDDDYTYHLQEESTLQESRNVTDDHDFDSAYTYGHTDDTGKREKKKEINDSKIHTDSNDSQSLMRRRRQTIGYGNNSRSSKNNTPDDFNDTRGFSVPLSLGQPHMQYGNKNSAERLTDDPFQLRTGPNPGEIGGNPHSARTSAGYSAGKPPPDSVNDPIHSLHLLLGDIVKPAPANSSRKQVVSSSETTREEKNNFTKSQQSTLLSLSSPFSSLVAAEINVIMTTKNEKPQTNNTEEDSFRKPNGEAPPVNAWYGYGNKTGDLNLHGAFRDEDVIEAETKKEMGNLKTKRVLKNLNDETKRLNIRKATHHPAGNFHILLPKGTEYFSKGIPVQSTKQKTPAASGSAKSHLRSPKRPGRSKGGSQPTISQRRRIMSIIPRDQRGAAGPVGRMRSIKRAEDVEQSSHSVLAKTAVLPRKDLMKPDFVSRYKDLDIKLEDILSDVLGDAWGTDVVPEEDFDVFLPEENGLREIMATFSDSYRVPLVEVEVEITGKNYAEQTPQFRMMKEKVGRIRKEILRQGPNGNALAYSDRAREKRYANTPEQTANEDRTIMNTGTVKKKLPSFDLLNVKRDIDEDEIDLEKVNEEMEMDQNEKVAPNLNSDPNFDANDLKEDIKEAEAELEIPSDFLLEPSQVSVTVPDLTTGAGTDMIDVVETELENMENMEDLADVKIYDTAPPEQPNQHTEEGDDLLVDDKLSDVETMPGEEPPDLTSEAETERETLKEGEGVEINGDELTAEEGDDLLVDGTLSDVETMPGEEPPDLASEAETESETLKEGEGVEINGDELTAEEGDDLLVDGTLSDVETMPGEEPPDLASEAETESETLEEGEGVEINADEPTAEEGDDLLVDGTLSDVETMPDEEPPDLASEAETESETLNEGEGVEINADEPTAEEGDDLLVDGKLSDVETMPDEEPPDLASEVETESEMLKEGEGVEINGDEQTTEEGDDLLEDGTLSDVETMPDEEPPDLASEAESESETLKEDVISDMAMIPDEADTQTETVVNEGGIPALRKSPHFNFKIKMSPLKTRMKPLRKKMYSHDKVFKNAMKAKEKTQSELLKMQIAKALGIRRPTINEVLRRQQAKAMMRYMLGTSPSFRLMRQIQGGLMRQREVGVKQEDNQQTATSSRDKGKKSSCSTCSTEIVPILQQPRLVSPVAESSQTSGITRLQEETMPTVVATADIIFRKGFEKLQERPQQVRVISSRNLVGNVSQTKEQELGRATTHVQVSDVENNDFAGRRSRRSSFSFVSEGGDEISVSSRQKHNGRVNRTRADDGEADGDAVDENGRSVRDTFEGIHRILRSALRTRLRRHEDTVYKRQEAEDDYVSSSFAVDGIAGDAVSAMGVEEDDEMAIQTRNREPLVFEPDDDAPYSGYSVWGEWSSCSVTCGFGRRQRSRSCQDQGRCMAGNLEEDICMISDC